ncbi:hypothetical protein EHV15_35855 [Paenibacillus oralis]|uniref:Uncharacterized protein n=1 Tax=Paenibacillus oralis TaxID=2490856 RepID=A0A3P3TCV9_9BACL|nr:hypothetical protein [Paenibacillus oralis]RRJ54948.1 hypothetical protein EHV15_35855 [Paenibacillus oralis]
MTRITYANYGDLEHIYSDMSKDDFVDHFWTIFGQPGVPRNTGGIQIISIGPATDERDTGGFSTGKVA